VVDVQALDVVNVVDGPLFGAHCTDDRQCLPPWRASFSTFSRCIAGICLWTCVSGVPFCDLDGQRPCRAGRCW
jgi:hypothetical protein